MNEEMCVSPNKVSSSTESEAFERMGMDESGNMSMTTSNEDLDMALHNQLLSRSADAHISMKQYQNAVTYLEQARDIQDVLEDDIKGFCLIQILLFKIDTLCFKGPEILQVKSTLFQATSNTK